MKVKELIAELQKLDPELDVAKHLDDCQGGFKAEKCCGAGIAYADVVINDFYESYSDNRETEDQTKVAIIY